MGATDEDGYITCERCGRRKPVGGCGCGGTGTGPMVPEGWNPELTPKDRPRLPLTSPGG